MKKIVMMASFLVLGFIGVTGQKSEVFNTPEGAIHGFDAVAYFKDGQAFKGNKDYLFNWKGADWYFVNRQNLDSFKTNPEKFAPQFGGYCAYGMADGHKAPTEPDTWTIVDNKLYLNYNKDVRVLWKKDTEGNIQKANTNWVKLKDKD